MQYQDIMYTVADQVATITLNRPDRLNAWTGTMEREVRAALTVADQDPAVRAIIITGAGRGFCAGADMSLLQAAVDKRQVTSASAQAAAEPAAADEVDPNFEQKFSYMLKIGKPIVAAINGPIAGIGVCLALFCDLRYMASNAKLTTAFARRGLIAEHGISWMLPRLVGTMNALDLLYSARAVEAPEVERMGLVRALPAEGFLDAVRRQTVELVESSSPRSIRVMKRQVFEAMFQSLAEAWRVADEEMEKSFSSEDFKEGVAHFLEKRKPAFTGR